MPQAANSKKGKVYLVGAGPGQADLITVRGAELLKAADCIIYDKLANPALLKFACAEAEIIHVPKRIGPGSCTQTEINKLLVEKGLAGKAVVRLKGGDPCMFGRAAEELRVLADAGIDFEIVPGVTAATGAGAYAGIMLTDRNYSSQVVFVTGHEASDKTESNIDWPSLARLNCTIVFYMGVGNLEYIAEQLITNGMKDDTPAAVIADATLPAQRVVKAALGQVGSKCRQEKVDPPAVIVIGPAAESDARFNWLMKKPLFGKNIVVTRDSHGNADLAARIIHRAGNPVEFATVEIRPLTEKNSFVQALARMHEYDWVVFTSANGVRIFFDSMEELGKDARVFGTARIAAIGPQTAGQLGRFGIRADFIPTVFTGKELARGLIAFANVQNKKFLLLRSEAGSKELPDLLGQAKARVDDVAIYTARPVKRDSEQLKVEMAGGRIDWVTFASPSAVRAFFGQIPHELVNSSRAKVASIGPVTSAELKGLGVGADVEAAEHTVDGLLTAMEGACS
ncbi:MAG: uroporphyrinogen-III C-methyltransferase [Planctomycetota bacterium]|jgi:uroporphyrinogen III methyltransferase/synthase